MAKSKNPITNDADLNSTPCLLSVAGSNFGKKKQFEIRQSRVQNLLIQIRMSSMLGKDKL